MARKLGQVGANVEMWHRSDDEREAMIAAFQKAHPHLRYEIQHELEQGEGIWLNFPFKPKIGEVEWMWVKVRELTTDDDGSISAVGLLDNDPMFTPTLKRDNEVTMHLARARAMLFEGEDKSLIAMMSWASLAHWHDTWGRAQERAKRELGRRVAVWKRAWAHDYEKGKGELIAVLADTGYHVVEFENDYQVELQAMAR